MKRTKKSKRDSVGFFELEEMWQKEWIGMPEYEQKNLKSVRCLKIHFRSHEDMNRFAKLIGQPVTNRTKSLWFPQYSRRVLSDKEYAIADGEEPVNPRHPVYVISKSRWNSCRTSRALDGMGVPHFVVVEPQECAQYASVIDRGKILVLPFGNLGLGSIPARNWVWNHAVSIGAEWHWILDDNIRKFYRLNRNCRIPVSTGAIFRAAEDFVERYENIAQAGFQYRHFSEEKNCWPPFFINTRIYSCILIRNDLPYRWRGRYNEDTDLSLRMLKDGWQTVLFYAFIQDKAVTMSMRGGNTDELYSGDGRFRMAKSLQDQHPEISRTGQRWSRSQHVVDYSSFRKFWRRRLRVKPGRDISAGINNYGMILREVKTKRVMGDRDLDIITF